MDMTNFIISFLSGSIVTTIIFAFLLRSDSFITWLVETVTEILIKKMNTKKQNEFTNYLGVFFVNMGIKFIESLKDDEIINDVDQLKLHYNNIKTKLLQKEIVSQEDIDYIDSLKIEKQQK